MDAGQASMCAALCNELMNQIGRGVAICAFSRVCRLAIRSQRRLTLKFCMQACEFGGQRDLAGPDAMLFCAKGHRGAGHWWSLLCVDAAVRLGKSKLH